MDKREDTELTKLIQEQATYYEAPKRLRERISFLLDHAKPDNVSAKASRWAEWRHWWAMGAAFAAGMVLTVAITFLHDLSGQQDRLVAQVIDSHVRSLMVAHLSDVVSSDQHTVKPWFSGKLAFSPPVYDLAPDEFSLIGGRLDYIDEHPVAALVYRYHLHTINVFIWPVRSNSSAASKSTSRDGFNVTAWTNEGMQFWAVSDVQSADLQRFTQLLRNQSKP